MEQQFNYLRMELIFLHHPQNSKKKGKRIFVTALSPPKFTLENYKEVLFNEGLGQAFINTLAVAIPSSIIPLVICSFFAYALTWMQFFGRGYITCFSHSFTSCSITDVTDTLVKYL